MGCRQCLSLSVVQLKGKHCQKLLCRIMGCKYVQAMSKIKLQIVECCFNATSHWKFYFENIVNLWRGYWKFNCYSKKYVANCESYDDRKSGENSNFPGTHSICTFFSLSWKKFLSHNCWFVRQLEFVKRGMWTNSKKIGKSNWFSRTVTLKNYVLLTMVAK